MLNCLISPTFNFLAFISNVVSKLVILCIKAVVCGFLMLPMAPLMKKMPNSSAKLGMIFKSLFLLSVWTFLILPGRLISKVFWQQYNGCFLHFFDYTGKNGVKYIIKAYF